jgi:uncharacterized membrane protein SpoIIM required for sporulation
MTETKFVHKNASRWSRFEDIIKTKSGQNPDALADVFLQLTDDLAYARTHFPKAEVTGYLNGLATNFHNLIYKNKREKRSRFAAFWRVEAPMLFYKNRRYLLYSLIIFLVSCAVGALSAEHDATYLRMILGDGYVDMTLENIEKGDPMGVYKSQDMASMFFGITFNNIKVSLLAFAAGIFFSFGTGVLLFYNGIMLGAFQYFFYQKGLLLSSFLTIWIHGTLEISSIVLAGGAGLVMGHAFAFPGTYSRSASLIRGAREGVKMVLALVPIFVVAGFLESYVTRLTEMPAWGKWSIILASACFIGWYFVYYPVKVNRSYVSAEN